MLSSSNTVDVIFYEDTMYFSSESELQGEYQKEIKTLYVDILECDYPSSTGIDSENNGNLNISGIPLDHYNNDQLETREVIEFVEDTTSSFELKSLIDIPY